MDIVVYGRDGYSEVSHAFAVRLSLRVSASACAAIA